MSHRNPRRRRCRNGGRNARHHLKRDPRRSQSHRLLTPATIDERVSALQPYNRRVRPPKLDQQTIDVLLPSLLRITRPLADIHQLRPSRSLRQQCRIRQPVVQNHIRRTEHPKSLHRNQLGITRPRSDQVDHYANSRPHAQPKKGAGTRHSRHGTLRLLHTSTRSISTSAATRPPEANNSGTAESITFSQNP